MKRGTVDCELDYNEWAWGSNFYEPEYAIVRWNPQEMNLVCRVNASRRLAQDLNVAYDHGFKEKF